MNAIVKARLFASCAYALGAASIVFSFWLPCFLGYAAYLFFGTDYSARTGQPWWPVLYEWTRTSGVIFLLEWTGLAAVLGALGLVLASRARRVAPLGAAAASRLARAGLAGVALNVLLVGLMVFYRMHRMGW